MVEDVVSTEARQQGRPWVGSVARPAHHRPWVGAEARPAHHRLARDRHGQAKAWAGHLHHSVLTPAPVAPMARQAGRPVPTLQAASKAGESQAVGTDRLAHTVITMGMETSKSRAPSTRAAKLGIIGRYHMNTRVMRRWKWYRPHIQSRAGSLGHLWRGDPTHSPDRRLRGSATAQARSYAIKKRTRTVRMAECARELWAWEWNRSREKRQPTPCHFLCVCVCGCWAIATRGIGRSREAI